MALLNDYQSVFLKAAFNSMLPEFMDSDVMDEKSISPEMVGALRKIADYFYKDEETTQRHIDLYESKGQDIKARALRSGGINDYLVNDFFNTGNFTKNFADQGMSSDIKMMLGRFAVQRNSNGGYLITDKYDFSSNTKYLQEYLPEVSDELINQGYEAPLVNQFSAAVKASAANFSEGKGAVGTAYPMMRMFGGLFMPDNVSPEEGGAQHIRINIPSEDMVDNVKPSPRPTWFEDENVEPVFPSTPMDDERKGLFDMAMEAIFPSANAMLLDTNTSWEARQSIAIELLQEPSEDGDSFQRELTNAGISKERSMRKLRVLPQ